MSSTGQTTISAFYQRTNTNTNTNTSTESILEMPDDSTSFLLERLKSMSDKLPKVDGDGFPYTSKEGQTGKQSVKSRQHLNSDCNLHQYFKQHNLQHRPLQIQSDPRIRASSRRVGPFWTQQTMLQAAMEFCIPVGLMVCFVCPELWDRDLLRQHDEFKRDSGGVMAPCLRCTSMSN